MFLASYFSSYISLALSSTWQIAHALEEKDEERLLLRRQLESTKPVEAKDRVNDYETYESRS